MAVSVVGFDVGSLTSYIGVARGGGIEVITNEYSDRNTPTCIAFAENMRLIGTAAKLQQVVNIRNTFVNFVQLIGKRNSDPMVARERNYMVNPVEFTSDGRITFPAVVCGEKTALFPEQLLAMQLTKLKHIAEASIGCRVVDVVLNVPTYCTDAERRAILDASRISGLNCVKLVNDITAIGTAYGFYCTDLPAQDNPPKVVAFVSIGYTSTQVALCAYNLGKMKVLSTVCDAFLGGRDFDQKIFSKFVSDFQQRYNLNIHSSPKATIKLLLECEKLKKAMSANVSDLPLNAECIMNDKDISGYMKRSEFEEICSDLVNRFKDILVRCLEMSKLIASDVHAVELVGGSSRIPVLKSVVAAVFKQEGKTSLNADEAVARGCAFQAAICSPAFRVRDFDAKEICLYPIIVQLDHEEGGDQEFLQSDEPNGAMTVSNKDMCIEVFPHLHPIPSSRQIVLTRRGPLNLEARYSNPELLPNQNVIIGTFKIGNAINVSNERRKIRLKLRMNTHGIFNISQAQLVEEYEKEVEVDSVSESATTDQLGNPPKDPQPGGQSTPSNGDTQGQEDSTVKNNADKAPATQDPNAPTKGKVLKKKKFTKYHDINVDVMNTQFNSKQLNELCEAEANLVMRDKLEGERVNAKNAVEEFVYEMRSKMLGSYEGYATPEESEWISGLLNETENWLYDEGENVTRQVYADRLAQLKSKCGPIASRASEHLGRPQAVESYNRSLMRIKKVLDSIAAGEATYDHLTPEQTKHLENMVIQSEAWLNQQLLHQNTRPKTSDPVVKISDIASQQQAMESVCHPIINTPKPVIPQPQVDGTVNSSTPVDTNNANNPEENHNHSGKMDHSKKNAKAEENMDLD